MKTLLTYFTLCVLAAWIPRWSASASYDPSAEDFPGWAAAPAPANLSPLKPSERETRFASGFPGRLGVFTDGTRTYAVRWVCTATRKLHPASDCLRALGYTVHPAPIFAEADGTHWGTINARRNSEPLRVRERIVDSVGREWTDVSAWYWSAALGRSTGPWWAITIFERPTDKS